MAAASLVLGLQCRVPLFLLALGQSLAARFGPWSYLSRCVLGQGQLREGLGCGRGRVGGWFDIPTGANDGLYGLVVGGVSGRCIARTVCGWLVSVSDLPLKELHLGVVNPVKNPILAVAASVSAVVAVSACAFCVRPVAAPPWVASASSWALPASLQFQLASVRPSFLALLPPLHDFWVSGADKEVQSGKCLCLLLCVDLFVVRAPPIASVFLVGAALPCWGHPCMREGGQMCRRTVPELKGPTPSLTASQT